MTERVVIREAAFSHELKIYWYVTGLLTLVVTGVGIVLLPFWLVGGWWYLEKRIARMSCAFTDKSLLFSKGILFRVEKTIPLEKITDMGLKQGPVMRMLNLHLLSVETAGQSGPGALLSILGIEDTLAFRDQVLGQRDLLEDRKHIGVASSQDFEVTGESGTQALLSEIRDSLLRIEEKIGSR